MSEDADRESFMDAIRGAKQKDKEELMPDQDRFPPFYEFEETGDWIKGILSNPRKIPTRYGDMKVMDLTNQDGTVTIGLTYMLLILWDMVGKTVVIRYTGKLANKTGKGSTKQFEVYEV